MVQDEIARPKILGAPFFSGVRRDPPEIRAKPRSIFTLRKFRLYSFVIEGMGFI